MRRTERASGGEGVGRALHVGGRGRVRRGRGRDGGVGEVEMADRRQGGLRADVLVAGPGNGRRRERATVGRGGEPAGRSGAVRGARRGPVWVHWKRGKERKRSEHEAQIAGEEEGRSVVVIETLSADSTRSCGGGGGRRQGYLYWHCQYRRGLVQRDRRKGGGPRGERDMSRGEKNEKEISLMLSTGQRSQQTHSSEFRNAVCRRAASEPAMMGGTMASVGHRRSARALPDNVPPVMASAHSPAGISPRDSQAQVPCRAAGTLHRAGTVHAHACACEPAHRGGAPRPPATTCSESEPESECAAVYRYPPRPRPRCPRPRPRPCPASGARAQGASWGCGALRGLSACPPHARGQPRVGPRPAAIRAIPGRPLPPRAHRRHGAAQGVGGLGRGGAPPGRLAADRWPLGPRPARGARRGLRFGVRGAQTDAGMAVFGTSDSETRADTK